MVYSLLDLTAQPAFQHFFFYCYFFGRQYPRQDKPFQEMLVFEMFFALLQETIFSGYSSM